MREEKVYIRNIRSNRAIHGLNGICIHELVCDYETASGFVKKCTRTTLSAEEYASVVKYGFYYRVSVN